MNMATSKRNQIEQWIDRAKLLLEKNNSAVSLASNQLFSLLEGWESSFLLREHLDTILDTYASASGSTEYSRDKLRSCQSIVDKIAFVVWHTHGHLLWTWASTTSPISEESLLKELNKVMKELERDLIKRENFTESWIIRHAAFNNFECNLSVSEQKSLSAIAEKMRKVAKDKGLVWLAEIMHFQKESDAQQIIKIKEGMAICAEQGIDIDTKITEQFELLSNKIKPLEDLDKNYKHLMNTLNAVHRTGRKGFKSMINSAQQKKLLKVVEDLWYTDSSFLFDALSQAENPKTLEKEFLTMKTKDVRKFTQVLRANNITQSELESYFFSYFGFRNIEQARLNFDHQKQHTFGNNIKAYEWDINSWRWLARNKIFALHANMHEVNGVMEFGSPADYQTANSYFEKFKDIFFANEDDAFGPDGWHYRQMRDVVAAIVRRRVPAICATGQRKFGFKLRRVIKKMNDPKLLKKMERWWKDATDAELLAMIIMAQNESTNTMFYDDKNIFTHDPKGLQKFAGKLWRTEMARTAVRDVVSKPANTFFRLGEGALRLGTKGANKIISKTGRATTWATSGILAKINRAIEWSKTLPNGEKDRDFKRWKTPLYGAWLLTRPMEALSKATNKWFQYTDQHGNAALSSLRQNVVWLMQEWFDDKEIKHTYQWFFHAFEGIASFLGKSISSVGDAVQDIKQTQQQRTVLGSFFEAAGQEEDLMALMQSSDLGNLLNLKESGPYIFDLDGRVTSASRTWVKEYRKDADGAKEYMKDQSAKIMEDMHASITKYADRAEQIYREKEAKLASMSAADPWYDALQKEVDNSLIHQDVLNGKATHIADIISHLSGLLKWAKDVSAFHSGVNGVYSVLKNEKEVSDTAIKNAKTEKAKQEKLKKEKAKEIEEINAKLSRYNPWDLSYTELTSKRSTKEIEKNEKKKALREAENDILDNIAEREGLKITINQQEQNLKSLKTKQDANDTYNSSVKKIDRINEEISTLEWTLDDELAKITDKKEKDSYRKKFTSDKITPLKESIRQLNRQINNLWTDGLDHSKEIETLDKELVNTKSELATKESNYKKLVAAKEDAQDEYDKTISELAQIDVKLSTKMAGDRGRSDLETERKAAERELEDAETAIIVQTRIIDTETQRWKIHADFYRWAIKLQGFAEKMKKNETDNLVADPATYSKEVQRLISEFNAYLLPQSWNNTTDKMSELKKILNTEGVDDETRMQLLKELIAI